MTGQIGYRLNTMLGRHLPEQRLFLRSDTETRFIRLSPTTQAIALGTGGLVVAWTILASATLFIGWLGAGDARAQTHRAQVAYEARLNAISAQRDERGEEAARAQARFNVALDQVSRMQTALLASEDRRDELETGIGVIQKTLRRTIDERDQARAELAGLQHKLATRNGASHTTAGRSKDVTAALGFMTASLAATATQRDQARTAEAAAKKAADRLALDERLTRERNKQIFDKLQQAVSETMKPLKNALHAVGLSPDTVLKEVRQGYHPAPGATITHISLSTMGGAPDPEEQRANAILDGLHTLNLYRIATDEVPLGLPLKTRFRYSSPFGGRHDPVRGGHEFHEGQDMAGAYGSPIYATADGVVVHAGWEGGYGRMVAIENGFGLKTRFGHMSKIRVHVGQRVSRGDQIGDMGSSGRSTGPHVHYEVRVNGKPVNPMTYIKAAANVF